MSINMKSLISPAGSSLRSRAVFITFALAALAVTFALPALSRRVIHARQTPLPENLIPRAAAALREGRVDEGVRLARKALDADKAASFEGRGVSAISMDWNTLADECFARGKTELGRLCAWRALRLYHLENHPLEWLDPWRALAVSLLGDPSLGDAQFPDDPARFTPIMNLLVAHSPGQAERMIEPLRKANHPAAAELEAYARLRYLDENKPPEEARAFVEPPGTPAYLEPLALERDRLRIRQALREKNPKRAIEIARAARERAPEMIETEALLAQARSINAMTLIDDLATSAAARTRPVDLAALKTISIPTMQASPFKREKVRADDVVAFYGAAAAELPFTLESPASEILLVLSGTELLGVGPVALATVDDAPVFPLYIPGGEPALFVIRREMAKGDHTLRLEYINDSRRDLNGRVEDRNLRLWRAAVR